jgi:hypothetical protein
MGSVGRVLRLCLTRVIFTFALVALDIDEKLRSLTGFSQMTIPKNELHEA